MSKHICVDVPNKVMSAIYNIENDDIRNTLGQYVLNQHQ
jgi:hypothetical protein